MATVTKNSAKRCVPLMPAFVLLYTLSDLLNPADTRYFDIESFRARRVWPEPETDWRSYKPEEWAKYLLQLRRKLIISLEKFRSK